MFRFFHLSILNLLFVPLFNSLAPGKSRCDFKNFVSNLVSLTCICRTVNTLRWMTGNLTDGKSALIQVMAWCPQATRHYLSQCWPRSMSPNGITRPQWVNELAPSCARSSAATVIINAVCPVSTGVGHQVNWINFNSINENISMAKYKSSINQWFSILANLYHVYFIVPSTFSGTFSGQWQAITQGKICTGKVVGELHG